MKSIILFICLTIAAMPVFAQFTDTAALNQYIKETLRDRRPNKVSGEELQTAFLGVSSFLGSEGGGSGPASVDTLTREEAEERVEEASLIPGRLYCITDADKYLYMTGAADYDGTKIVLRAESDRKFSTDGIGYFYNPNYRNGEYTVWNGELTEITITSMSGAFQTGEQLYVSEWYLQAIWLKPGQILLRQVTEMEWSTESPLTLYSYESGASAEIQINSMQEYAIGDKVIWGGYVWTNLRGKRGYYHYHSQLNVADWQQEPYTSPEYVLAIDAIKYDWEHDAIIGRREEAGDNEVYSRYHFMWDEMLEFPVQIFQWGNPYSAELNTGIGSQRIINGFNFNLNFIGGYQTDIDLREGSYQWVECYNGSSQSNIKMRGQSSQDRIYLLDSSLQENISFTRSYMGFCVLDGALQKQVTLRNAQMTNFGVADSQVNVSAWGRIWYRRNAIINAEENIHVFPFIIEKDRQAGHRLMAELYIPPSTTLTCEELTYPVQAGMDYTFEYELMVNSNYPDDTIVFTVNLPAVEEKRLKYTIYNLTTGEISHYEFNASTDATLPINGYNQQYLVKITGWMKNTEEGEAMLSVNTPGTNYSSIHLREGTQVKFTRAEAYTPPDM